MILNKKFRNYLCYSVLILVSNFIYFKTMADETNVYCANINKNWFLLSNGNVKVHGTWHRKKVKGALFQIFFIIEGGINEVIRLQNECKKEFGEEYIFAQPINNRSYSWHTFAIDENNIIPGFFSYQLNLPARIK